MSDKVLMSQVVDGDLRQISVSPRSVGIYSASGWQIVEPPAEEPAPAAAAAKSPRTSHTTPQED